MLSVANSMLLQAVFSLLPAGPKRARQRRTVHLLLERPVSTLSAAPLRLPIFDLMRIPHTSIDRRFRRRGVPSFGTLASTGGTAPAGVSGRKSLERHA